MKFLIVTHVPHSIEENQYAAYGPFVREMNIWGKYVENLIILGPITDIEITTIDNKYEHHNIEFAAIDSIDVLSIKSTLETVCKIPQISVEIYSAMKKADHIHLRCPGNIGLLGCFIQILFPFKTKTAKYAGNWDPNSKQPWTYRLQQWILSNTFFTRNIQVLVYGEWEGSSKNIKPFFTATYKEEEKIPIVPKDLKSKIHFIFAGTLVKGKNPLYAIQLVELLLEKGYEVCLDLYGEGLERNRLSAYIEINNLGNGIVLKGNHSKEAMQQAYQKSHFVILPSESEGWPKVIAEGMFWGCVPLSTSVSCVPFMLDKGKRGVMLEMNLEKDVLQIEAVLNNQPLFDTMQKRGSEWSRKYTIDLFEKEIKRLLQS